MKRTALVAAGTFVFATVAHADDVPASISNQSPDQAAMSEAITTLLIKQLGEDALWTKLVGRPRQYNQYLYVNVPQRAIKLGSAAFDKTARLEVRQSTQWVENCNGTQDLTQTVETTTDVVNSYYDTQAQNSESSLSRTVTLDVKGGIGLGSFLETSYSFNHTNSTSETSSTRDDHSNEKMVKETLTLIASPGQSVAYQTNQVVLTGSSATFTASATLDTSVMFDFYVKTIGTLNPDVGASGNYVPALDNTPVSGQISAAADLRPGNRVLRSPDGAFIFGMETGKGPSARYGLWSVIDLNSSQPGMPSRLWSPVTATSCGTTPLDFVMTSMGQLQLNCGKTTVWKSATSTATGNPCFYLTFVPEAPGELACYSAPPAANGKITFLSGVVATRTTGDEIRPGLRHIKKTLMDLLPDAKPTQEVSFIGTFNGAMGVLGPVNCLITYNARPAGSKCDLVGLAHNPGAGGARKGNSTTPSGQTVPLSYCGPTNAFLAPYLAKHPLSVSGN